MSKNMTITIPEDVWKVVKQHPEINWSNIAKKGVVAFTKILSEAEIAQERIAKDYGPDVNAKVNFGINENSANNRFPGEDGMIGSGYNANIGFNVSIYPTRATNQNKSAKMSKVLEDFTK